MAPTSTVGHRANHSSSCLIKPVPVGEIQLLDPHNGGCLLSSRKIYPGHDLVIGRDKNRCQWILEDPQLSAKHLRIYTIVYDDGEDGEVENLVYAEDLSRNGSFWNDSLIGKGNGGFLLSHDDKLRLSARTSCRFIVSRKLPTQDYFDLVQEREMTRFQREYVITDRLLGTGAFGRVFMAIEQHTRTQVACKVIDLRKFSYTLSKHFSGPKQPVAANELNQGIQTSKIKKWAERQRKNSELEEQLKIYYREIEILSQLSHPNIIGLDKVYVSDNTLYIFQDLITAGDLFSYLESKNGRLLEVEAAVIIRQVLVALEFLHDQDIVHRDLKPENIMMTSLATGCRVVLTDFGAARRLKSTERTVSAIGSEPYTAPEVKRIASDLQNTSMGYTRAVDMWSVGAVTVVLLTGSSAFSDPKTGAYSQVLARNCDLSLLQKSKEWQKIGQRPRDFIISLLVLHEHKRLTVRQALEHIWFSNEHHRTDFEELYQRTIKNWYPRAAKSPVVEFLGSSFVRHLTPPKLLNGAQGHQRKDKRAVNPPYKPFPRNMHILLWPKRRHSSQVMSTEVKTAITEIWTGNAQNFTPRYDAPQARKIGATANRCLPANIKPQTQSQVSDSDVLQSRKLPAMLPVRVLAPCSIPEIIFKTNLMPEHEQNASGTCFNCVDRAKDIVQGSKQELSSQILQKLSDSAEIGLIQKSRLSQKNLVSDVTKKPSKRWRDSMYDIVSPNENDGGQKENVSTSYRPAKQQKVMFIDGTTSIDQGDAVVMAHSDRIALEMEYVDKE